jgi:hypothetical protein
MRRTEMRPLRVYETRTGAPALLLDDRLWDKSPDGAIAPSAKGSTWTPTPGARRGVLVVQRLTGALTDKAAAARLNRLVKTAQELGFPQEASSALGALQERLPEELVTAVVNPGHIIQAWDQQSVQYRCPGIPDTPCGTTVSTNSASRLRAHHTPDRQHCQRSNTPLTAEEREAALIAPDKD